MPRDTQDLLEATPDLSTPSLEALAWLLRHKEAWPEGFEWDFSDCAHCADGLAARLWHMKYCQSLFTGEVSRRWKLDYEDAFAIFTSGASGGAAILPEHIADRIDAYLARTK